MGLRFRRWRPDQAANTTAEERFVKSRTWLSILVAAVFVLAGEALLPRGARRRGARGSAGGRGHNGTVQTIGINDLADGEP
jgi:hypothetical protein